MVSQNSAPIAEETGEVETEMTQPIIVDLGKQKASKLKALKEGEGELWDDILDVIEEVKEMLGPEAEGKLVVPIILLYEKKQKRARLENILFPLAQFAREDDEDDENEEDED